MDEWTSFDLSLLQTLCFRQVNLSRYTSNWPTMHFDSMLKKCKFRQTVFFDSHSVTRNISVNANHFTLSRSISFRLSPNFIFSDNSYQNPIKSQSTVEKFISNVLSLYLEFSMLIKSTEITIFLSYLEASFCLQWKWTFLHSYI